MITPNPSIQILQFGTGNFLRAFIEPMVQDISSKNNPLNICMIQSTGGNSLERLKKQNFEYHLVEAGIQNGQKVERIQKITCVKDGISLPQDAEKFLNYATEPEVKWIISNVTEAGMVWKEEGSFKEFAESFAGRLTQWLYVRFEKKPSIETVILPCELISDNGDFLKSLVIKHAQHWNLPKEFSGWIDQKCRFFNTLVDRIVPGFPKEMDLEKKKFDQFVVQAEPYSFWAIEGKETDSEHIPFLQSQAEVVIAESIDSFSLRKIRILNGCHTFMAVTNLWKPSVKTVREFLEMPLFRINLEKLLYEEIIPSIPMPANELEGYARQVFERFANPYLAHQLQDIALNSIAKFKSRILPVIQFHLQTNHKIPYLAGKGLVYLVASYLTYPDRIRDTSEVANYFQEMARSGSLSSQLQHIFLDQFNLEWNENWEAILEEVLKEKALN